MNSKDHSITAIILAGGKSSRMGQEKGLMKLDGDPFISHIINEVKTLTNKILIITNHTGYHQFGYPCIVDSITDCGPIGGIYTALSHTKTENNLILSCDIPFIKKYSLEKLMKHFKPKKDIIHYENNPLIGIYKKSLSSLFLDCIQKKQLKLQKLLSSLQVQTIIIEEDKSFHLKNINTPQQYKEAIA
ncbi:molybdenum cofactor guanylyltransferase [Aquimarina sp. RZ0]|uniref:molybdenum cofactor guanylyltransferase n=1 Tax=Aquimarina sp. RZ0 TaxID=2607730 RepID=UPI0011F0E4B1|nr:molybdenum cofactor guanylyltransferase [Aquimarina sp. RZ0]KAA1248172.1 molybdenum cofactor guanylyltransferase [Aquimarina sp. RZ0]